MNQFFRRLSTRLYLVLSISVCLIFVALMSVSIKVQEHTLREQSEHTLEQVSDIVRDTLEIVFSTRFSSMRNFAETLEQRASGNEDLQPLLDGDSGLKELFDHIWLLNHEGLLIGEWPRLGAMNESFSMAHHPLFLQAQQSPAILLGKPEPSYYTDELIIHLVAPVYTQGLFTGAVVAIFSLQENTLLKRLVSTSIGRSGIITITHRDGTVIAHPDSSLIGYQLHAENYPLFHYAVDNQWQGVLETEDASGKSVLQSIRWLHATDWLVTTTMPLDEAMLPAYRMRRIQLVVGLASLFISLALLSWIIRAYLKPMNRLQLEVVAVQQGELERLTEPGIDELRQLVFRFNNLLAQNKINQSALEQRQAYLDNILESSSAGLLMTDDKGNIEYVNPHLTQITGYSAKELLADGMTRYISESQRERIVERFNLSMQDQARMEVEFEFYHGEGKMVWLSMETAPIFSSGLCIGYVGTVRDTTSDQERIHALRMVANEDALTGLLNRRGIEQALSNCFIEARVNNRPLLVLALDLDNFKAVNDKFGHASGDDVLRQVAQLMRQFTRETDFLGRLGGDEFTIILPGCPQARGKRIAEDLQRTISTMTREREDFPEVSVSIGLVGLRDTDATAMELLQRADDIAYAAKNAGRNQWISDLV